MKTFTFTKHTTNKIVEAFNNSYVSVNGLIDDVMALATIQKHYGIKCKIHVFKTYIDNKYYAFYSDSKNIVTFDTEKDIYEFIFGL